MRDLESLRMKKDSIRAIQKNDMSHQSQHDLCLNNFLYTHTRISAKKRRRLLAGVWQLLCNFIQANCSKFNIF